jgi:hypothetical protein
MFAVLAFPRGILGLAERVSGAIYTPGFFDSNPLRVRNFGRPMI